MRFKSNVRSRYEAVQFLNERSKNLTIILLKGIHNDESGQGLVEYLFIVAFVALAATAGMTQAASYINSSFVRMGQRLGGYFS